MGEYTDEEIREISDGNILDLYKKNVRKQIGFNNQFWHQAVTLP